MRASFHAASPLIAVLAVCALGATARAAPDWTTTAAPGTSGWAGSVQQPLNVAQLRCQESAPYQVYFGSESYCVGATTSFAVELIGTLPGSGGPDVTGGLWSFQLVAAPPPNASWNPSGGNADVWVRGPPAPHGAGCVESVFRGVQKIITNPDSKPGAPLVSIAFTGNAGPLPCTGFPP